MPNNHGRSPRPNNGLHSDCLSYAPSSHGGYAAGLGTLRASGGDIGGAARCLFLRAIRTMRQLRTQRSVPHYPQVWAMGGYVPMIVSYGFDSYNQTIETETAQPLRSHGGGDTTPKVVVMVLASIAPNAERTDGSISPTIMHRAGTGGGAVAYPDYARDRKR